MTEYFPILIFITVGIVFGCLPLAIGWFLGPKKPSADKLSAYECGFPAFDDARSPVDVRFYLVAILFILFDLETAFLFPWAVALRDIGWLGIAAMGLFLSLLTIGFVYEWRKGALEWE